MAKFNFGRIDFRGLRNKGRRNGKLFRKLREREEEEKPDFYPTLWRPFYFTSFSFQNHFWGLFLSLSLSVPVSLSFLSINLSTFFPYIYLSFLLSLSLFHSLSLSVTHTHIVIKFYQNRCSHNECFSGRKEILNDRSIVGVTKRILKSGPNLQKN